MKTIVTLAKELQAQMTTSERNDGTKYYHLIDGHPEWMTDVIHGVLREAIFERTEADVYTSNLTAWLNARNDHVYYLTEALEEMEIKNGFQALMAAQQRHKEEVALDLVNELEKLV